MRNNSDEKMQKRASNVLRLAQENDKLQAELREMSERIQAAEARLTQEKGLDRNNNSNNNKS
jgi:outer membrane murein-binding lipoprotein Lpp